jgi:hypothetical protein
MIDKFKKANNIRLTNWVKTAVTILKDRGIDIRIYIAKERPDAGTY